MVESAAEVVGACRDDDAPQSSERVATPGGGHPDWELEPCGAARRDGQLFICLVDGAEVRFIWRKEAPSCSAIVPRVVLEHVLRVQRFERV
jgi:hypothetical protein